MQTLAFSPALQLFPFGLVWRAVVSDFCWGVGGEGKEGGMGIIDPNKNLI